MAEGTETVKSPLCGMEIEVGSQVAKLYGAVRAAPRATITHEGTEYHFCCNACKKKFDVEPDKYARK
jgi:YHS domain-containing protein